MAATLAALSTVSVDAADLVKVAIGQRGLWDSAIVELGRDKGIFAKHGVTTEIVPERSLAPEVRAELEQVMRATGKGEQSRGFAMILDRVLDGTHPGTFIALARSRSGEIVAFQRYATADGGRDRKPAPSSSTNAASAAIVTISGSAA